MSWKSELVVHVVNTGAERVVLQTERHIEAPNWTRDGALIVNGEGRLFEVKLDAPELVEIETGGLTDLNNDHGVSPNGNQIVVSDRGVGGSCIYVLPRAGGVPQRVTPLAPSYWHGWSPDGARLAYVGRRGGAFTLLTCAVDGTDERDITRGFDHVDGPDYTADGAWIWFNGEIDGSVDLWRIRPDGRDPEKMSEGASVDWFPHPSPDGKSIVYLAYPEGTKGHPGDLDVELRLMSSEGGVPTVLCRIFGGQGSINVPSWNPGGNGEFAYMRYARPDGSEAA